ncbi:TPA: acyltransferase [Photobacterium damselae]
MYIDKFFKLLNRLFYFIYFFCFKIRYWNLLITPNLFGTFISGLFKIHINNKGTIFIGKGFKCRHNLYLNVNGGKLKIRDNVFINSGVSINCQKEITIGNETIIGESVKFYDHNHIFNQKRLIKEQGFSSKSITIGNNVWICSNVIILKGVSIGDNSVVSAGSIVKKDIPMDSIFIDGKVMKIDR